VPRVIVVTGASAGVGRATAREFARQNPGCGIALLARGEDGLEGAKEDVEALGARALVVPTDVADAEAVEAAAERVERELGPIDVWVNNAMTTVFAPFMGITAEEFRRVTEVTYLGQVHGTQAALKRMVPRDQGTIVLVGSALAYRGIPLQSAYCGSKHAVKGFFESVRTELMHDGSSVHLTMVQLPGLNTPQFRQSRNKMEYEAQPVAPIYQPELAARAIVWASGQRRRQVYVGASTVMTILGNKVAAPLGDLYLARTGYDGQQTDEPRDRSRPDYLFEPVPGDRGAHGPFDEEAHETDPQFWATRNRGALVAAGASLAGLAAYALLRRA
jgi:NAD(P)-dependent dehydrogenase (short-subunit alcohol dehydrogenase family)